MTTSRNDATARPTSAAGDERCRALLAAIGEPMLACSIPLADPAQYSYEVKFDGYRILAAKHEHSVRLQSRRAHDWTSRFSPVADAVARLSAREAVIDGEVCAVTADGRPSFQRLQQWVGGERREVSLAFAAFDLLWLDGRDLRSLPLEERRSLLLGALGPSREVISPSLAVEVPLDGHGRPDVAALVDVARRAGLEGFIAKRRGSPWVSGRSSHWIKLKCVRRQELAVAGYTPLAGRKANVVGGLILATRAADGRFRFAGKVGSGLDDALRRSLAEQLERDRVDAPSIVIDEKLEGARWSTPRLVVEVSFLEWSDDGKLRHPILLGVREDKRAEECVRDDDARAPAAETPAAPQRRAVHITNPDKVLFPRDGIRKREVVAYYEAIADVMLPHLRGRPVMLERWPDGIDGESWYQQRPPGGTPSWIRKVAGGEHLILDDVDGLRWAANLAALTLHTWSSRVTTTALGAAARDLALPDHLVLDLDPGVAPWPVVIEVALAVRRLLEALELPSFPKTSGKRGLHVMVPFARGASHEDAVRLAGHLASAVAKVLPGIATVERLIARRRGRLYVDFLQNGFGKTVAAAYTLRAVDGAPASTPLRWSEVGPRLDPGAFTLRTVRARVDAHGDLLGGVLGGGPDIRPLLSRLR